MFIVGAALLLSACSQTVVLRTDSPAQVILDGEDLGEVTPSGKEVEIPYGSDPVAYVVKHDDVEVAGAIPREPWAGWAQGTVVGAAATSCGMLGFGLANPGACGQAALVLVPVIGWIFAYGSLSALLVTPGWASACLACGGCAAGGIGGLYFLSFVPIGVAPEVELSPRAPDYVPAAKAEVPP